MAKKIASVNVSYAFQRTKAIPLDNRSLYDTYEEALLYAQTGKTAYAGYILSVVEDTAVTLYQITASHSLQRIATVEELTTALETLTKSCNESYTAIQEQISLLQGNDEESTNDRQQIYNSISSLQETLSAAQESISNLQTALTTAVNDSKNYTDTKIEDLQTDFNTVFVNVFQDINTIIENQQGIIENITILENNLQRDIFEIDSNFSNKIIDIKNEISDIKNIQDALSVKLEEYTTTIFEQIEILSKADFYGGEFIYNSETKEFE